mmetsp:Transcript_48232/g.133677  ORF Transcript_48232/g.133677 Transcript_48232/m.133677 type:complete len:210 (-) Transcript_48232:1225-1854(-)
MTTMLRWDTCSITTRIACLPIKGFLNCSRRRSGLHSPRCPSTTVGSCRPRPPLKHCSPSSSRWPTLVAPSRPISLSILCIGSLIWLRRSPHPLRVRRSSCSNSRGQCLAHSSARSVCSMSLLLRRRRKSSSSTSTIGGQRTSPGWARCRRAPIRLRSCGSWCRRRRRRSRDQSSAPSLRSAQRTGRCSARRWRSQASPASSSSVRRVSA